MEHTEFTPDWENVKPIMNYMAIDEDGEIWHYENEPSLSLTGWYAINGAFELIGTTTPTTDFNLCLYKRPQTETEHEQ